MNFVSSLEKINFGEALLFMVIGMLIIIAVLSLLVGLLYIIRYAVAAIEKPKKTKESAKSEIGNDNGKPAVEVVLSEETDEEVVAAITAAITCILQGERGDETVVAPFVIKKIKHIR